MCNTNSSFKMSVNGGTGNIPAPLWCWTMAFSQQELQLHRLFHCCTCYTHEMGVAVRKITPQGRILARFFPVSAYPHSLPCFTHPLPPSCWRSAAFLVGSPELRFLWPTWSGEDLPHPNMCSVLFKADTWRVPSFWLIKRNSSKIPKTNLNTKLVSLSIYFTFMMYQVVH